MTDFYKLRRRILKCLSNISYMFTPDRKFGYEYVKLGNSGEEWFISSTSRKCEIDLEQNCKLCDSRGYICGVGV
jgi:hypothetical protein